MDRVLKRLHELEDRVRTTEEIKVQVKLLGLPTSQRI